MMLGALLRPLLKLAIMLGVVLFGTVLLAGLAVTPLHYVHPATPQALKTIGAGIPLVCFGGGFLVLVFGKTWRVLKYAAPVGFLAPSAVFVVSLIFAVPQMLSTMTVVESVSLLIAVAAGAILVVDIFTGRITGEPWFRGANRQSGILGRLENADPIALSASTSSIGLAGGFEIVEIPEEYVVVSETQGHKIWEPFRNIVRAMMVAKAPVGLRLEMSDTNTRLYYLTHGMDSKSYRENMDRLHRVLTSVLPKFRFQRLDRFSLQQFSGGVVGTLSGEILTVEDSRQRADPLTIIAESLLQTKNCIFQTYAVPETSRVARAARQMLTGHSYRTEMKNAQQTVSTRRSGLFSIGGESSSTVVDVGSAIKADRLYRKYHRDRVEHACNTEISVACWGSTTDQCEQDARFILEVAKSVIIPDDPSRDLKIRIQRRPDLLSRIMSGRPLGQMTLLTPEEAAALFTIAKCDLSIVLSKRETFSTATRPVPAPERPEQLPVPVEHSEKRRVYSEWRLSDHHVIYLGNPIGASGSASAGRFVWLKPQKLESHLAIYGNTRSGKTTTALSIVAQAMKCGLKVLIVVPMRSSDWTVLMHLFPDSFWVFKVGETSELSLRINIFQPPPGVQVASWILVLRDLMSSWMPNDRVMRMHLDDVLHTTYRHCGWDSKENKSGRPILLSDFWNAVEKVCLHIPYGTEIRQNFYGAIYSRVSNLLRNKFLVDMYNTEEGITWEQLASNNILVDVQGVPSDEDRSFVMGLLSTGLHMYKMAHQSKKISNLLVLEEASYILKRPDGPDHYGQDSSRYAVNRIVEMLTTGGGNGLGVMILEQVPSRLTPEVVKLIVNTIVHALGEESERRLIGGHIGVDEKRIEHVHQLGKGETIIFLEGEGSARNVKILPLNTYLDFPLPTKSITDSDISRFMEPVHRSHPNLTKTSEVPREVIERIERAKPTGQTVSDPAELHQRMASATETIERQDIHEFVDFHIRDLAQNPRYVNNLVDRIESAKNGDLEPLVMMVREVIEEFRYEQVDQFWTAERLLTHSNRFYPNLLSDDLMNMAVQRLQEQLV